MFIWHYSNFWRWDWIPINFPLRTTFAASHRFWIIYFHWHFFYVFLNFLFNFFLWSTGYLAGNCLTSIYLDFFFLIEGYLLYRILLFSVIYQQESAIDTPMSPPSWISLLSSSQSHLSILLQSPCVSSLSHMANFHWLSIVHMLLCFHVSLSIYLTLSLLPSSCVHLFSKSVFPLLLCKQIHQYHLSRFHIYTLVYDIYISFSDLLHSV